jgi:hypothetical protein
MAATKYNRGRNVPAVRTVAERPAPVIWRYNVRPCASSGLAPQVNPRSPRIAGAQNRPHVGRAAWYNKIDGCSSGGRLSTEVRNSPPECSSILTDCRAAGLHLLVILTLLQHPELGGVITDGHHVSHDPNKIVRDAQEVVSVYHPFLLQGVFTGLALQSPGRSCAAPSPLHAAQVVPPYSYFLAICSRYPARLHFTYTAGWGEFKSIGFNIVEGIDTFNSQPVTCSGQCGTSSWSVRLDL